MTRLRTSVTLVALLVCSPSAAMADVVLDWNAIAVSISGGQGPFAQARFMAITQLAVFEAVNAITGDYKPYLGTVVAPAGASADAAAVAAAYYVLKNYFPLAPNLDATYEASLAVIPNGSAKSGGIATGQVPNAHCAVSGALQDAATEPAPGLLRVRGFLREDIAGSGEALKRRRGGHSPFQSPRPFGPSSTRVPEHGFANCYDADVAYAPVSCRAE